MVGDPFLDASGQPRRLRGVAVISGAPKIAELAGRLGFDTVWIEVEHGGASYSEIEVLCMAVEAGGAQFLYLILFSYAFFFKGLTGLAVTIGSVVTLFAVMQLTGRIRWAEKFGGRGNALPAA